jgi:hypothetical protein
LYGKEVVKFLIKSGEDSVEYGEDIFKPELKNNRKIYPKKIYIENQKSQYCISASTPETFLWSQPLYIYQNKYPSSIINEWNGQLKIDSD